MTPSLARARAMRVAGAGIVELAEALVAGLGCSDGVVPVEQLCALLGADLATADLDAPGLLVKAPGLARPMIVVRGGDAARRRRFTTAHELAHLVLDHRDGAGREPMDEAFADGLAALLLAPPSRLAVHLRGAEPDVRGIRRLADRFELSVEAAARAYVANHPEPLAAVIVRDGAVERCFRDRGRFPFVEVPLGEAAPAGSAVHRGAGTDRRWSPAPCDGWIRRRLEEPRSVVEQVERWRSGGALVLLRLVAGPVGTP